MCLTCAVTNALNGAVENSWPKMGIKDLLKWRVADVGVITKDKMNERLWSETRERGHPGKNRTFRVIPTKGG